ncbi:hypothetical protein AGMMS50229_20280 [Campylobacterota bacterium]|nr:hypothetical protein AGMMS50229_20280 [Campylobacterota bacterium]
MYAIIMKFIRALNSNQSPWQVTLALTLGMFVGLTPTFAPHNLIIILLAFLLNVNLGIFFVSFAIFALISYGFDPIIEGFGYWILTHPAGEEFFTALFNNPLSILTKYNHTMVMGAFATSLILALPLFFTLNFFVAKYRLVISKTPVAKLFLAKPEPKKAGIIRWWGLLLFLVLGGLVAAVFWLLSDQLIKSKLEEALSAPIGYQVTIDRLHTTLSPLGMTIEGVQIPDTKNPMKNSVEIGRLAFNLDIAYLLHKKVLIDELVGEGVQIKTDRKKAAIKLPDPPKVEEPEEEETGLIADAKESANDFFKGIAQDIPDVKTVIKNERFKTLEEGEAALERLKAIKEYWENAVKTKFDKQILKDLEAQYKELEAKAKSIKNEKDVFDVLDKAKAFKARVKALRDEYKGLYNQFESDRKEAKALIDRFPDLPKEDFEALRKKYSFDFDGAFNLTGAIMGDEVQGYINTAIEWYNIAKPYVKQAQALKTQVKGDPIPKAERGVSRVVVYTEWSPKPTWWLKKAGVEMTLPSKNQIAFKLLHATSDQRITKEPMTVAVASMLVKGYEKLAIAWTHDRRGVEKDTVDLDWLGVDFKGFHSGKFLFSPAKINLELGGTIDRGKLESRGDLSFSGVKMTLESPKNELEKLVVNTLSGIDRFVVNMHFWDRPLLPKSSFSSDLDNQLGKRFKEALSARLKEFEAQLKAEIEKIAKAELAKLGASEADIAALEKVIKGETDIASALEEKIGVTLSEDALKKELKKRLEEEAKKKLKEQEDKAKEKLKKEAADKLKGLLKK